MLSVKDFLKKYTTISNNFIDDFFELYDITFFTKMYGFDQNITISGFIKFIDEELKEKCPNLECIDDIDTLELVKESLNIIKKLYKSLLEDIVCLYLFRKEIYTTSAKLISYLNLNE